MSMLDSSHFSDTGSDVSSEPEESAAQRLIAPIEPAVHHHHQQQQPITQIVGYNVRDASYGLTALGQNDQNQRRSNASFDSNRLSIIDADKHIEKPFHLSIFCFSDVFGKEQLLQACENVLVRNGCSRADILQYQYQQKHGSIVTFVVLRSEQIAQVFMKSLNTRGVVVHHANGEQSFANVHCAPSLFIHQFLIIRSHLSFEYQQKELITLILRSVPGWLETFAHEFENDVIVRFCGVSTLRQLRFRVVSGEATIFAEMSLGDAFRTMDNLVGREISFQDRRFMLCCEPDKKDVGRIFEHYARLWPFATAFLTGFPNSMSNSAILSLKNQITPIVSWQVLRLFGAKAVRALCQNVAEGSSVLKKTLDNSFIEFTSNVHSIRGEVGTIHVSDTDIAPRR